MSILVGKAIYSILSGDTNLHTYISGATQDKIYPIFAPDEVLTPFIVYERKNVNATYSKDGYCYDDCTVVVNIVSNNYLECITISELVRKALELKTGTFNGISIYSVLLNNVSEDFGVDGFNTSLEFAVKCK